MAPVPETGRRPAKTAPNPVAADFLTYIT